MRRSEKSESLFPDHIGPANGVRKVRESFRTRTSDRAPDPGGYDSILATFAATCVHAERGGKTVHGSPPSYLSWPMVRGDEFVRIEDMDSDPRGTRA